MRETVILAPDRLPLVVEVARTKSQTQLGIINRNSLDGAAGMLFEFPVPTRSYFWMKQTSIPLTIAWFRVDGSIVDWMDLEPKDETPYAPDEKFSYVLEVPQGTVTFSDESKLRVNHLERMVRARRAGNTIDPEEDADIVDDEPSSDNLPPT